LNLKNILILITTVVLFSACSSKDKFYEGVYNYIHDDKFCANSQDCQNKRIHPNDYNQNEKMNYENYKSSVKESRKYDKY